MNISIEKDKILEILDGVKKDFFSNKLNHDVKVKNKGSYDLVTSLDYEIENYIIRNILKYFPNDNIISEETKSKNVLKERNWIIDPIDGTCNFANNIPIYGVQLAFLHYSDPIFSFILHPTMNELFFAEKGKGALLNGEKIVIKGDTTINQAIITLGDFSKSNYNSRERQIKLMSKINDKVLKFRMLGTSCFDLSYLAAGRTHAHIMFSKNMWDIIPGLLIAKEAGAVVSSIDGGEFDINNGSLIASSSKDIIDFIILNANEDGNYE